MKVRVIKESGYDEAVLGITLSYHAQFADAAKAAERLAPKDGGHNKFLESIAVWIDLEAPRYFWQQFDTYRVGMTKQSESTEHTILKRELSIFDFEDPAQIYKATLDCLNADIRMANNLTHPDHKKYPNYRNLLMRRVKENLPEGFLQRRILHTNYKTLRNIFRQRLHHKLPLWQKFIYDTYEGLEHPEFVEDILYKRGTSASSGVGDEQETRQLA